MSQGFVKTKFADTFLAKLCSIFACNILEIGILLPNGVIFFFFFFF